MSLGPSGGENAKFVVAKNPFRSTNFFFYLLYLSTVYTSPGWTSLRKGLEILLKDFGLYQHETIIRFMQVYRLHNHDVTLSFQHIPKQLD